MSPFTPIGEVSRWKVLYAILQNTPMGGIAPYEELATALDLDPVTDRHTIQVAIRRAAQELEGIDKRAVEPVTNVGYRVVEVTERLRLARQHQRKAVRSLSRGKSKLVNIAPAELATLPEPAQKLIHNATVLMAEQLDFNRRTDIRQKNFEDALATVERKSTATQDQVAALAAKLEALNDKLDKKKS